MKIFRLLSTGSLLLGRAWVIFALGPCTTDEKCFKNTDCYTSDSNFRTCIGGYDLLRSGNCACDSSLAGTQLPADCESCSSLPDNAQEACNAVCDGPVGARRPSSQLESTLFVCIFPTSRRNSCHQYCHKRRYPCGHQ